MSLIPKIFDLHILFIHALRNDGDQQSLFNCSLVCREFNKAASKALYTEVILSPPFKHTLNLQDQSGLSDSGQFISSCLPQYANHVQKLRITGHLSSRPPPRNTLGQKLLAAIQAYQNLISLQVSPAIYHPDVFPKMLHSMTQKTTLRELVVNSACATETSAPILLGIGHGYLEKLTLIDPTRAILNGLPSWLGHLSSTSVELHLKDNCGSITPAILQSFIPSIKHRIRSISLGLSYSLTDDDVYLFLAELPTLTSVELYYYLQLKRPPPKLPCRNLTSFSVIYRHIETRNEALAFSSWIRRAVTSSSGSLRSLRLCCADGLDHSRGGANVSFDGLASHITAKHYTTLRFLDMRDTFIGEVSFKRICQNCVHLEELFIGISLDALLAFGKPDCSAPLKVLHTASFFIRNAKLSRVKAIMDNERVTAILNGPRRLRRLRVNDLRWEACWECTTDSGTNFVIRSLG